MTKANLDFAVTVFQHRGKELIHDHRLIFREEEFLNMGVPGGFNILEPDHVQAGPIDEEGNTLDVADADEVSAVFDERDKHLPVTLDALAFSDVARDLRCADNVSGIVLDRRDRERHANALPITPHSLRLEMFDSFSLF